jgi:hypothetical protein
LCRDNVDAEDVVVAAAAAAAVVVKNKWGVIGAGIGACIFIFSTITAILFRPSKSYFLSALTFNCCTEFTRNTTLSLLRHFALKTNHFCPYIVYFQDGE